MCRGRKHCQSPERVATRLPSSVFVRYRGSGPPWAQQIVAPSAWTPQPRAWPTLIAFSAVPDKAGVGTLLAPLLPDPPKMLPVEPQHDALASARRAQVALPPALTAVKPVGSFSDVGES